MSITKKFSLVVVIALACGSCKSAGGTTSPVTAGGKAFLQCEGQNLLQLVGSSGETLIQKVGNDLDSNNYVQLIADLVGTLGPTAVGCAVVAVESVESSSSSAAGSGSGSGSGSAAPAPAVATNASVRLARSKELMVKYGWQLAPAK